MGVTGGSAPVAVVTGYEAGLQAAAYAKQQSGEAVSEEKVEKVLAVLEEIRGNETGEPWQNIGNAARQIVNTFAVYPLTDERIKKRFAADPQAEEKYQPVCEGCSRGREKL